MAQVLLVQQDAQGQLVQRDLPVVKVFRVPQEVLPVHKVLLVQMVKAEQVLPEYTAEQVLLDQTEQLVQQDYKVLLVLKDQQEQLASKVPQVVVPQVPQDNLVLQVLPVIKGQPGQVLQVQKEQLEQRDRKVLRALEVQQVFKVLPVVVLLEQVDYQVRKAVRVQQGLDQQVQPANLVLRVLQA